MKRYLKYFLSLLLLTVVLIIPVTNLKAAEGNGTSSSETIGTPPATNLKSGSVSKNKTGWL